jgi:glutamine synthetase
MRYPGLHCAATRGKCLIPRRDFCRFGNVPSMPASLEEALICLEEDHDFLLKGDVFTAELIETYISYKRKFEADAVRLRPHPYEFSLSYDI